ncbi:MAG: ParB/RepB/Spo0J family partition protein [Chromatiales bacterium]|nr:ParB/RepB/Spo0J family partition protein [Chromatiales bacterium]
MSTPKHRTRDIPLDHLTLSTDNVRNVPTAAESDAELRASILSLGILENLLVREAGGKTEVVSGGRRLRILNALAADGEIPPGYPVPCRVLHKATTATEASLHENEKRVAMHPADQFVAYKRMRDDGLAAAEIATRAGVTEQLVVRRLRLAAVAPEILDAYRDGKLNLESVMAFTITDDQGAQKALWSAIANSHHTWPQDIRNRLTEGSVNARSNLARFVTLKKYEAAGGKVDRDLFAHDDDSRVYLADRALVIRLATEALQTTADRLAKQWKWTAVQLDPDWDHIHTLHRLRPIPSEPTAAETKKLQAIEAEIKSLDDKPASSDVYRRVGKLNRDRETLRQRIANRAKFRPEDMKLAGCVVHLDGSGKSIIKGLVRPEDLPAKPRRKTKPTKAEAEPEPAADTAPTNDGDTAATPTAETPAAAPPAGDTPFEDRFDRPWATPTRRTAPHNPETSHNKENGLSAAVIDDLKAIRTGITRIALAKRFDLAFDLVAYQLVMSAHDEGHISRAADIRLNLTPLRPLTRKDDDAGFSAANPGEQLYEPPGDPALDHEDDLARFDAFRALPPERKHALFAAAAAGALHNHLGNEYHPNDVAERLVDLLDIDFAAAVRPTETYFWKRLTKAQLLEIGQTVIGDDWHKTRRSYKKGELAADMAAIFGPDPQGRAGLDAEARDRVEQWVMPGFTPWNGKPPHEARPRRHRRRRHHPRRAHGRAARPPLPIPPRRGPRPRRPPAHGPHARRDRTPRPHRHRRSQAPRLPHGDRPVPHARLRARRRHPRPRPRRPPHRGAPHRQRPLTRRARPCRPR